MEFPKLSSPTLKDLFVRELENMILSGKLSIGEQLPSERDLAAAMGVSRAVVNAGIVDLAGKGFVEIRPRVGAFVDDYRRRGSIDTLLSIMRYNGGILRRPEIQSMLEIRLVLETLAIELIPPKLPEESRVALRSLLAAFEAATDPEGAARMAFDFHHELCMISGNILLPLIFYAFREPVLVLWERYIRLHGAADLKQNAGEILGRMEAGDVRGAISALTDSITRTIEGGAEIYYE